MIKPTITFLEPSPNQIVIKCKPGLGSFLLGLGFLSAAIYFGISGKSEMLGQNTAEMIVIVAGALFIAVCGFIIWLRGWVTVTISSTEGIYVRKLLNSFHLAADDIVWGHIYYSSIRRRDNPSYNTNVVCRIKQPDNKKTGVKDFENRIIAHNTRVRDKREEREYNQLKTIFGNMGFGVPEEIELTASWQTIDLNWLKQQVLKHSNNHVRSVCMECFIEKGSKLKDYHRFISKALKSKKPLVVYGVGKGMLALKDGYGYSDFRKKHHQELINALEKLETAKNLPEYLHIQISSMTQRIKSLSSSMAFSSPM